jgi:hypothetical protein
MTASEYKSDKARIGAEYQADRQKCGAGIGNGVDLCVAHARGAPQDAPAELKAADKRGSASNYVELSASAGRLSRSERRVTTERPGAQGLRARSESCACARRLRRRPPGRLIKFAPK